MNTPGDILTHRATLFAAGTLSLLLAGCQSMNQTQAGALVGTGLGAVTGAMVGSHSGHTEGGALIGAAAGALAGGLIGNAEDARVERDAAIAQAAYAQRAVTNVDVLQLARSGVGDDVIISTIRSQGGRFDLSPQAIIALKNSGVSDQVILAMQHYGRAMPAPVTTVIAEPAPRVIYVPPGPRYHVSIGSGRYYGGHHRQHWDDCHW
ncbi:MAG: glycine zipper domain-containing protein [Planctomycetaceae bacterium]